MLASAMDTVAHVRDSSLSLEDPGALELDLLGSEALEQTAPLAEEHRNDMELDLVEDAGREPELRGSGTVDEHVPVARGLLGSIHRIRDVVHVRDPRPLLQFGRIVACEDEDRHAIVVVAAPTARRLEGPPAGDDRSGRHELFDDLAVDTARTPSGLEVVNAAATPQCPIVQTFPAVTQAVVRPLVGPGDEPVEGHGHVEN